MIKMNNFKITDAIFNEIHEVENNWENYEENYDIFQQLASNEMEDTEDKENEFDVLDTLENIIFIGSISKNSLLYSALVKWYEYKGKNMKKSIRSFVEDNDNIYYVTGCGYDTIDSDLLGGKADGETRKEFLQWINS